MCEHSYVRVYVCVCLCMYKRGGALGTAQLMKE